MLDHRTRLQFLRSLAMPHPESIELADLGFDEWAARLPVEDVATLVDQKTGAPIRWVPGEGWQWDSGE